MIVGGGSVEAVMQAAVVEGMKLAQLAGASHRAIARAPLKAQDTCVCLLSHESTEQTRRKALPLLRR